MRQITFPFALVLDVFHSNILSWGLYPLAKYGAPLPGAPALGDGRATDAGAGERDTGRTIERAARYPGTGRTWGRLSSNQLDILGRANLGTDHADNRVTSSISCDGATWDRLCGRSRDQLNLQGRGAIMRCETWGRCQLTAGRRSGSGVSLPRSHERTQSHLHPHTSLLPPPAPRPDAVMPAPASAASEQNNGLTRVRTTGMGRGRPQRAGDRSGRWGGRGPPVVCEWGVGFSLPDLMILTSRSNDSHFPI